MGMIALTTKGVGTLATPSAASSPLLIYISPIRHTDNAVNRLFINSCVVRKNSSLSDGFFVIFVKSILLFFSNFIRDYEEDFQTFSLPSHVE